MNKKEDQSVTIHIASSASFSSEIFFFVWKDKTGFIKNKYGLPTFVAIIQHYDTKWWLICGNQVIKSSYPNYNCFYDNWNSLFISHFQNNHCQGGKFLQNTHTTVFMATKTGKMVSYLDWLSRIKLLNPLITWSWSTFTLSMVTKFAIVVTYFKKLWPINLHDSSMRWSCEVTWHKINLLYPHLQKAHGHWLR